MLRGRFTRRCITIIVLLWFAFTWLCIASQRAGLLMLSIMLRNHHLAAQQALHAVVFCDLSWMLSHCLLLCIASDLDEVFALRGLASEQC